MIEIKKRYVDEAGKTTGYLLNFDGLPTPVVKDFVWTGDVFYDLLNNGYLFYSYDADDIVTKEGQRVGDLPIETEIPLTEEDITLTQSSIYEARVSDAEISKYFSYRNNSTVSLRQPEEIEIHTRAELLAYLDAVANYIKRYGYCNDNRPLNSFCAREALFSMDELSSDSSIRSLYNVIQQRHILKDYAAYLDLVEYFNRLGLLSTKTPAYIEFLMAYYAWGPDGIKDDVISMDTAMACDSVFAARGDIIISRVDGNFIKGKDSETVLWSADNHAHFMGIDSDCSNIAEFSNQPIVLESNAKLFEMQRSSDWGSKYKLVKGYVASGLDRVRIKLISEGGYEYLYKATHNKVALFNSSSLLMSTNNFVIHSINPSIKIYLSEAPTVEKFYAINFAIAAATNLLKNCYEKPKYNDSFDMLIKEGVSPEAAINYIASCIYRDRSHPSNSSYVDPNTNQVANYANAFEDFIAPIPENILAKYDVKADDLESKFDILNYLEVAVIDLEGEQGSGNKSKKRIDFTRSINSSLFGETNSDEYFNNLEFVRSLFDGAVTINNFGDGYMQDKVMAVKDLAKIILSCAYAELGTNASSQAIGDYITNFNEETAPFDYSSIVKTVDAAARGCIKDIFNLRANKAKTAFAWLWCTGVYRELTNEEDISKQRHYLMSVIPLANNDKHAVSIRVDSTQQVINSFDNYYRAHVNEISVADYNELILQAPYIASLLVFPILARSFDESYFTNAGFSVTMPIEGFGEIPIYFDWNLLNNIYSFDVFNNIKYITLSDYCQTELLKSGWSWHMVNANVSPWHVTPKDGYTIETFNFALNWYSSDVIYGWGDDYVNAVVNCNGRIENDGLVYLGSGNYLIESEYADLEQNDELLESISSESIIDWYCNRQSMEVPRAYVARWNKAINKAFGEGTVIKTIPLKSDLIYKDFAFLYGLEVSDEDVYVSTSEGCNNSSYVSTINPDYIASQWYSQVPEAIEASSAHIYLFNMQNFRFDNIVNWLHLLDGTFSPAVAAYSLKNELVFKHLDGSIERYDKYSLNSQVMDNLADRGIVYQLTEKQYLVKGVTKEFVVEVSC